METSFKKLKIETSTTGNLLSYINDWALKPDTAQFISKTWIVTIYFWFPQIQVKKSAIWTKEYINKMQQKIRVLFCLNYR